MIDALYQVPLTFDDEDGEGVTLPALQDVGWVRTPTLKMPGTRDAGASDNFMLVHALLSDGLTVQEIEDAIAGPCLVAQEWPPVNGVRNELIALDYATLLDFMQDVDDIGTRPTNLNVMHRYAGRPIMVVNDVNVGTASLSVTGYQVT
jgi:hypothetical protein